MDTAQLNAQGSLSVWQCQQIAGRRNKRVIRLALALTASLIAGVLFGLWRGQDSNPSLIPFTIIACWGFMEVYWSLRELPNLLRDLSTRKARYVEGYTQHMFSQNRIVVDETRFKASKKLMLENPEGEYRIYYSAASRIILSLQPLDFGEQRKRALRHAQALQRVLDVSDHDIAANREAVLTAAQSEHLRSRQWHFSYTLGSCLFWSAFFILAALGSKLTSPIAYGPSALILLYGVLDTCYTAFCIDRDIRAGKTALKVGKADTFAKSLRYGLFPRYFVRVDRQQFRIDERTYLELDARVYKVNFAPRSRILLSIEPVINEQSEPLER